MLKQLLRFHRIHSGCQRNHNVEMIMKHLRNIVPAVVALLGLTLPAYGVVLLDDTFADGSRTEQNLPTESAWFANSSANIGATAGNLALAGPSGSAMYITYFTPSTAQPLNVGDTLQVTLSLSLNNVAAENTGRGVRIGLYDFSAGTRVAADSFSTGAGTGAPGTNVLGYMLNMNMGTTFGIDGPLQIMGRSDTASINLMGTTGAYTAIGGNGPGLTGDPAFASSTPYTMTFSVTRGSASSVDISTAFFGSGLAITNTVTDSTFNYTGFDTFAIRPAGSAQGAEGYNISEIRVDYIAVPEPSTIALAGLAALGLIAGRRRMRR